jgi:hypothetical protein
VIVLGTDLFPKFGILVDIFIDNLHCYYFVLEELHTICFTSHYHSYEVIRHSPMKYNVCKPSNLYDHTVLGEYEVPHSSPSSFVPLKYYLVENL